LFSGSSPVACRKYKRFIAALPYTATKIITSIGQEKLKYSLFSNAYLILASYYYLLLVYTISQYWEHFTGK